MEKPKNQPHGLTADLLTSQALPHVQGASGSLRALDLGLCSVIVNEGRDSGGEGTDAGTGTSLK